MASLESLHGCPSRSWHYGVSLLINGYVEPGISWQLANFCKADESLCKYLHVVHRDPTNSNVEGGASRSRLVEDELFFIKDWLVAGQRLFHYPFPHLKLWPNHQFYQKCLDCNINPPAYNNIQDREVFDERLNWKFRFADNGSNAYWRKYSSEFPVLDSLPNTQRAATSPERQWNVNLASLSTSFSTLQLNESESAWTSSNSPSDLEVMDSRNPNQDFFGPLNPFKPSSSTDTSEDHLGVGADGAVDRYRNKRVSSGDQRPSMAVFIHAGAGYHSIQNEGLHLAMCSK